VHDAAKHGVFEQCDGGTLLLVGWLFTFWFIAFRWLLPNDASLSPLALSTS